MSVENATNAQKNGNFAITCMTTVQTIVFDFISALAALKSARHDMSHGERIVAYVRYRRAEADIVALYCEKRNEKDVELHTAQGLRAMEVLRCDSE